MPLLAANWVKSGEMRAYIARVRSGAPLNNEGNAYMKAVYRMRSRYPQLDAAVCTAQFCSQYGKWMPEDVVSKLDGFIELTSQEIEGAYPVDPQP